MKRILRLVSIAFLLVVFCVACAKKEVVKKQPVVP